MSSSRKRAAVAKANREVEHINQKLMRAQHHASMMETFAKIASMKHDEKQLEIYELKLKYCPETLTEKDNELYEKLKKQLEEYKNPTKPEPIPQLIFAEEEYNEKVNLATNITE